MDLMDLAAKTSLAHTLYLHMHVEIPIAFVLPTLSTSAHGVKLYFCKIFLMYWLIIHVWLCYRQILKIAEKYNLIIKMFYPSLSSFRLYSKITPRLPKWNFFCCISLLHFLTTLEKGLHLDCFPHAILLQDENAPLHSEKPITRENCFMYLERRA